MESTSLVFPCEKINVWINGICFSFEGDDILNRFDGRELSIRLREKGIVGVIIDERYNNR